MEQKGQATGTPAGTGRGTGQRLPTRSAQAPACRGCLLGVALPGHWGHTAPGSGHSGQLGAGGGTTRGPCHCVHGALCADGDVQKEGPGPRCLGQQASTRGRRGPTRPLGQHKSGGLLAGLERWVWECTEGGPPRGAGVQVRKGASGNSQVSAAVCRGRTDTPEDTLGLRGRGCSGGCVLWAGMGPRGPPCSSHGGGSGTELRGEGAREKGGPRCFRSAWAPTCPVPGIS